MTTFFYHLRWLAIFISLLISALFISWQVSAKLNFLYPIWYHALSIDKTIDTYGPQNRYISGFASTTTSERFEIFAQINEAVHQQGQGLSTITFYDQQSRETKVLLRAPEILHLHDVARLIDQVYWLGYAALTGLALLLGYVFVKNDNMPRIAPYHWAGSGALGVAVVGILVIGAEKVFYQFHEWIFPPGHPWFFYYQDSLMSTSMQAPNLFGAIAVQLGVLAILLYVAGLWGLRKAFSRH